MLLSLSLLLILFVFAMKSKTLLGPHDHGQHCWTVWGIILTGSIIVRPDDDSDDSHLGSTARPCSGVRGGGGEDIRVPKARISLDGICP
ncbi:hypothetical protein BDR22DRAFT_179532 [Usnea florida]